MTLTQRGIKFKSTKGHRCALESYWVAEVVTWTGGRDLASSCEVFSEPGLGGLGVHEQQSLWTRVSGRPSPDWDWTCSHSQD